MPIILSVAKKMAWTTGAMLAVTMAFSLTAITPSGAAVTAKIKQIVKNGPAKNRVDLVILGDGYRAKEMGKFRKDSKAFADYIFKQSPFSEYKRHFNVLRIETPSKQSGASRPSKPRKTVYGAYFWCFEIERLLCIDNDKVTKVLDQNVSYNRRDMVIVLVNDEKYGGSGGPYAVASTNEFSREIAVHEFGHSFGHLDDEYVEEFNCGRYTDPWGFNVTQETKRSKIPWTHWIPKKTQLPTPDDKDRGPGLYEGAFFCAEDWYRPTLDSKMNGLLAPSFGPVNTEQLVRRIYETIRPSDKVKPKEGKVSLAKGETKIFKVQIADKKLGTVQTVWRLNGKLVSTDRKHSVSYSDLNMRNKRLVLSVKDKTPLVILDENGVLNDVFEWKLTDR